MTEPWPITGPYAESSSLVNLGLECSDCKSHKVIYHIVVAAPGFPCGAYCFKCLVRHCRASSRIPMPMEINLLDAVQRELGIGLPGKKWYFVPEPRYVNRDTLH